MIAQVILPAMFLHSRPCFACVRVFSCKTGRDLRHSKFLRQVTVLFSTPGKDGRCSLADSGASSIFASLLHRPRSGTSKSENNTQQGKRHKKHLPSRFPSFSNSNSSTDFPLSFLLLTFPVFLASIRFAGTRVTRRFRRKRLAESRESAAPAALLADLPPRASAGEVIPGPARCFTLVKSVFVWKKNNSFLT